MKNKRIITALVVLVLVLAATATSMGILSNDGAGQYEYISIRGKAVTIYGKGLYRDMSAEVAPQGIAQDYVTLFAAIPMLMLSLFMTVKGSLKARYLLAGTLGYLLVTYLFYTVMSMYNKLFLAYVVLTGASFYAFILTLFSFDLSQLAGSFGAGTPVKLTGGFLIFIAICIALLWLGIIVPPLLDGTVIPVQAEHYTTLIVQGLDLGILLPGAFICAVLWIKKRTLGYLLAPVYFIFLSLLMTALTAKVGAISILGYNVMPVIFIIPTFNLLTVGCMLAVLKNVKEIPAGKKKVTNNKAVYTHF